MRKKSIIFMSVATMFVFALLTWAFAADLKKKMTIHYSDGKRQVVILDEPSCEISNIDFSTGGSESGAGSEGKDYSDTKGTKVFIPCGKLAFVDQVVSFNLGSPVPKERRALSPNSALGEPDFVSDDADLKLPVFTYTTLGCGGSITLEFTKVRLVDVNGPDLHVFEVGPSVEPTQLEISKDGTNWINLGRISGGKASVDIHNFVSPGDQFRYVRLTDLRSACGGEYPGADIDAIGAIGCVIVE